MNIDEKGKQMELKQISVLGAGLMGAEIAQVSAQTGFNVCLLDMEDHLIENGLASIEVKAARDFTIIQNKEA